LQFAESYQEELLLRMTDKTWMAKVHRILLDSMFDPPYRAVAASLLKRYGRGKKILTRTQLHQLCQREGVPRLTGTPKGDHEFDFEEIQSFNRYRLLREGFLKGQQKLDEGKFDSAVESVLDASRRYPASSNGYPNALDARRSRPKRVNVVSTGIPKLDEPFNGGIAGGYLFTVLAPTSGGKTTFLVHLACSAARAGKTVFYYTLDDSEFEITKKIQDCIVGKEGLSDRAWKREAKKIKGVIHVAEHPPETLAVDIIEGELPEECKLLIVDYADYLLLPSGYSGQDYRGLGKIYAGLKRIGLSRMIPVATASQTNRASYEKGEGRCEDVELSLQKMMMTDDAISLNQRMVKDEVHCDIFVAKNRHGPRFGKFEMTVNWATCRFELGKWADD
jgi:RecA/RadA recombinase